LRRQTKQRAELLTTLRRELRELTRSRPRVELTDKSADLVAALVNSGEEDRRRLEAAISAVEGVGTVLPLDAAAVQDAYAAEHHLNLSAQDATVYASVRQHLVAAGDAMARSAS
jgi:predicted nucleic acid-binding protein